MIGLCPTQRDTRHLYYCSQRYYDPATMQWISADPAHADGEESACQYCGGDPVDNSDPTGLRTTSERFYVRTYGGKRREMIFSLTAWTSGRGHLRRLDFNDETWCYVHSIATVTPMDGDVDRIGITNNVYRTYTEKIYSLFSGIHSHYHYVGWEAGTGSHQVQNFGSRPLRVSVSKEVHDFNAGYGLWWIEQDTFHYNAVAIASVTDGGFAPVVKKLQLTGL
jgi:RHS repeat-associated protein